VAASKFAILLCAVGLCVEPAIAQVVSPVDDWPAALELRATLQNPQPNSLGFGYSVAGHGDTVVVGAPLITATGILRGMVAVFVRVGSTWTHQQTLTRSDGFGFGGTVAISGDTLIVGRLNYSSGGVGTYVYVRNGGTWTLQAELVPSGSSAWSANQVAVDGDTALVGYRSGGVYAFVRNGTVWTEQARLKAEDPSGQQIFLGGIALDGDTALVGAPGETVGANVRQGAAYVLVRSGTVWAPQARLTASTPRANGLFGSVLALSGNTALIGPREGYLFSRVGGTWVPQPSLPLPPPRHPAFPGYQVGNVAMNGTTAIASMSEGGQGPVAYYLYKRITDRWIRLDPATEPLGNFAISGDAVIAGDSEYGSSEELPGPGIAYIYAVPDAAVPQAPTLRGSVSGNTVSLNWAPSATGTAAASYVVEAGTASGVSNLFNGNVGNILQIAAPVSAGTYFVRVRGVNGFGAGDASNEVVLTVGPPVIPVPGPPTLTGSVNNTNISIAWTPSGSGGPPNSYVLEAGTAAGASNLFNGNVGGVTQMAASVTAGTYYLRVRGVNGGGVGAASNEVALTITGCALPSTPTGLTYTLSGNLLTVRWNAAAGAVEYFLLAGSVSNANDLYNGNVGTATSISATVPAGRYYIRVRGANACGVSVASPELEIIVP
jgi:hypothetical protein